MSLRNDCVFAKQNLLCADVRRLSVSLFAIAARTTESTLLGPFLSCFASLRLTAFKTTIHRHKGARSNGASSLAADFHAQLLLTGHRLHHHVTIYATTVAYTRPSRVGAPLAHTHTAQAPLELLATLPPPLFRSLLPSHTVEFIKYTPWNIDYPWVLGWQLTAQ